MFLFIPVILAASLCSAQPATDTVSTGASYANQVWHSLEEGDKASAPKNNWDIAFDATGRGLSVLINSVTGTQLWKYPGGDTTAWNTLDTAGLASWTSLWNADTAWSAGAFDRYADTSNPFHSGWGVYNMITHVVTGDSIFVVKLSNGAYKKIVILSLNAGTYSFKYANLDGSGAHTASVAKSAYTGKNFAYYSLQNDSALDREPASSQWDLVFTQYTTFIPTPYPVTGVLSNAGAEVAEAKGVADPQDYDDWQSHTFSKAINQIGYDWKSFTGTAYAIADSLAYFVKRANGDIWRVVFQGFGGGANGNFIFSKEKLATSTVEGAGGKNIASLAVYPNPIQGRTVTLVYSLGLQNARVELVMCDVLGRTVFSGPLPGQAGLHQVSLPVRALRPGAYFVRVNAGKNVLNAKFTVR